MSNNPHSSQQSAPPAPASLFDIRWEGPHTGRLLALLIVVTGFTLATLILVELTGGTQQFRALIQGAGPWAPLVYVLLKASTYVIAPLSGTTVKLASGALFGVWEGMLLSLLGDTLGGTLNYWIARIFGRAGIAKFAGKKALAQVDHAAQRVRGWRILLGARLLLSSVYDFISYAAGLARISFVQYLVVTAIGGIPISVLFAMLGNATVESDSVTRVMIVISTITLITTIIAYFYHKHLSSRPTPQIEPND